MKSRKVITPDDIPTFIYRLRHLLLVEFFSRPVNRSELEKEALVRKYLDPCEKILLLEQPNQGLEVNLVLIVSWGLSALGTVIFLIFQVEQIVTAIRGQAVAIGFLCFDGFIMLVIWNSFRVPFVIADYSAYKFYLLTDRGVVLVTSDGKQTRLANQIRSNIQRINWEDISVVNPVSKTSLRVKSKPLLNPNLWFTSLTDSALLSYQIAKIGRQYNPNIKVWSK